VLTSQVLGAHHVMVRRGAITAPPHKIGGVFLHKNMLCGSTLYNKMHCGLIESMQMIECLPPAMYTSVLCKLDVVNLCC